MAATFKTQLWDNTGWGWDQATAGSPCEQLCSELRSWITTINSNAAQSGKQVVLERDETSSTTANYRGFTINLPAINTTGSLYYQQYSSSATNLAVRFGNGFTDDTSNGGYGTVTAGGSDTSIAWKNTVTSSGQMQVAYGVVNGEEFFGCSWYLDSSSVYADSFLLFKDHNGEWAIAGQDGTSVHGWVYDTVQSLWTGIITEQYFYSTQYYSTMQYAVSTTGLTTGDQFQGIVMPKSSDIVTAPSDTNPLTYFPDGATGNYFAKLGYYAPYIRYTPV